MPWRGKKEALSHTKKADTPAKVKQWNDTANAVLGQTGDDATAIRIANAAVKNHPSTKKAAPRKK